MTEHQMHLSYDADGGPKVSCTCGWRYERDGNFVVVHKDDALSVFLFEHIGDLMQAGKVVHT